MKRSKYSLISIFSIFTLLTCSHSILLSNISNSNLDIQQIDFRIPLNDCQIKFEGEILVICKEKAYIFTKETISTQSVERIQEIPSIVDADIDMTTVVTVGHQILTFKIGRYSQKWGKIHDEYPILTRLKVTPDYTLLILLSQPKHTSIFNEETEETEQENNLADEFNQFVLHSFLFSGASHLYHLSFPDDELDFKLKQSSFKEMAIFNDSLLGHNYLLVSLEKGWLFIFKSFFEDPKFEKIFALKPRPEYEIKAMINSDNLLFLLLESAREKRTILEIYRLLTPNHFNFQKECEIDLSNFYTDPPSNSPGLRVKQMENTFVIMLNYPGSHILITTFKKPSIGIYKLECPNNFNQVNYSQLSPNPEFGYGFDFAIEPPHQGFLLSPIQEGNSHVCFIPYCFPNHQMDSNKKCFPCQSGETHGGIDSTCQPCTSKPLDNNHEILSNYTSFDDMCPVRCKANNTFGGKCEDCEKFLDSVDARIPETGYPKINTKGECSFECDNGFPNEDSGTCLPTTELLAAIDDHCAQITDCLNCTFSQSCSWCNGACKKFEKCSPYRKVKQDILHDFFKAAEFCNKTEPCGPTRRKQLSGNFSFQEDTVYKNQLCIWYPTTNFLATKEITLTLRTTDSDIPKVVYDNPPTVYMHYCESRLLRKACNIILFPLKYGVTKKFVASDVIFYMWVEESMIGNAQSYLFEYNMEPVPLVIEDIFKLLLILIRFIFISLLFSCFVIACQKYSLQVRRRRILREIQGLELFRLVDNAEEASSNIDPEEIMQDNRIVSRVVYEAGVNEFEQTECPICLESFQNQEVLAKLSCKHLFHVNCFHDWVKAVNINQQVKCPVCNRVLV